MADYFYSLHTLLVGDELTVLPEPCPCVMCQIANEENQ